MTLRSFAAVLVGCAGALFVGWVAFPRLLHVSAAQPLEFSHRVHVSEATGLACGDCHAFRDDGSFTGIPPVATCANCHSDPVGESASERRLVNDFVVPGREPAWRVYARQPDNVAFPHAPHVKGAGIACERCHGGHGASDSLPAFESDRISGYSRGLMEMAACEACHREEGRGTLACIGCHR